MTAKLAPLLAALIALLTGCFPGQRLMTFEVEHGGEVVLRTSFDVKDSASDARTWEASGEVPFSTKIDALEPSSEDPLRAELEGPVRVRMHHRVTGELAATVDGLVLVRSAADANDWRMPPEEVERTKTAARL